MNFVNNRFSLHVNDGTHGRVLRGNRRSGIVDGDGRRKAIANGMNFEQRIENWGGKRVGWQKPEMIYLTITIWKQRSGMSFVTGSNHLGA
jgi:hypothetical protein